jgi:hypothetical protein
MNELNPLMHGQEDEPRCGSCFAKLPRCLDSRETRHGYVQYDQVRPKSQSLRNKIGAISDSTHNLKARLQKYGYTFDDGMMIVGK